MKTIISNIEWKLPEFNAIYLASFNSIQLKSYRFYISECDSLAWELCLEFNRQKNNNVNIWLCQIGPDRINGPVNTKYKIYAIKDGESLEIAKSTYKFEYQEKLGFTEIEFKKLMSFDGKLSFYCEVLADYNFIDNLKDTYMDIFEKEIFTDCVIKVGDEIIKTHRCVLAKNSEVFRKMFEQKGMTETQNGEVIISDSSPECVRALLEFFYSGEISTNILKRNVMDIFVIAHKYQVEKLQYQCESFISAMINPKNIVNCFRIISLYNASNLEKAVGDYIRINITNILNTKEWDEIENLFPQLAFKFLKGFIITNSVKEMA